MFEINNKDKRATPLAYWGRSGIFIVNFEKKQSPRGVL